jgi:hypothetical protein
VADFIIRDLIKRRALYKFEDFHYFNVLVQYRRPSLSAGLLFAVLIIRGYLLVPKNLLSAAFPSLFTAFGVN